MEQNKNNVNKNPWRGPLLRKGKGREPLDGV